MKTGSATAPDAPSIQQANADREWARRRFAEHSTQLRAAVRATVHTSETNVEDACAFAWLQLVRYGSQLDREKTAFGWLLKSATREAIKLDRRTRRTENLEPGLQAADDNSRDRLDARMELIAAIQTIGAAGLRPRERRALILRAIGYSRGEIAAMTGESCRSVDRQLARARRKLRAAPNASEARRLDS